MIRRGMFFLFAYSRASWNWLKKFAEPKDHVIQNCPAGHPILKTWDKCPDCQLMIRSRPEKSKAPKIALYCTDGPHQGDVFILPEGRSVVGHRSDCDLVLSAPTPTSEVMEINAGEEVRLEAPIGSTFLINGKQSNRTELLDFDQLDIMGNRFTVLDLNGFGRVS